MTEPASNAPEYKTVGYEEFDGNPLLAHLPHPPDSPTDTFMRLAKRPKFDVSERLLSAGLRGVLISRLRDFYVPTHKAHYEAYSGILTQIFDGYTHRNPLTAKGQALLYGGPRSQSYTPTMSMIAGCSGMGKSTLLTQIFNSVGPPLVQHTEFRGQPFTESQVIALRKNVPERCTVKILCSELGSQADQILGQKLYGGIFGKLRGGDRGPVVHEIRKIISNHHVGVLVIDEFQNLSLRGVGAKEIIAFLVNLRDELGVPIVLCGTYKALDLLRDHMTTARRLEEGGYFDLSRPRDADDTSWRGLCEAAWDAQWVRDPVDFSDEICSALFEVSQGVTAIMIAAFRKAQLRAIREGTERVDAALIQKVYDQEMTVLHPSLTVLKSQDRELMLKFDDLFAGAWNSIDRDRDNPPPRGQALDLGSGSGHLGAVGAKDALGMSVPKKARGSTPKQKISDEDIERDVLGARISGL